MKFFICIWHCPPVSSSPSRAHTPSPSPSPSPYHTHTQKKKKNKEKLLIVRGILEKNAFWDISKSNGSKMWINSLTQTYQGHGYCIWKQLWEFFILCSHKNICCGPSLESSFCSKWFSWTGTIGVCEAHWCLCHTFTCRCTHILVLCFFIFSVLYSLQHWHKAEQTTLCNITYKVQGPAVIRVWPTHFSVFGIKIFLTSWKAHFLFWQHNIKFSVGVVV